VENRDQVNGSASAGSRKRALVAGGRGKNSRERNHRPSASWRSSRRRRPQRCGKNILPAVAQPLDEPTSGTIRFNGRDYRELGPRELRRRIGMVMQTAFLFPGTVADNVAYGGRLEDLLVGPQSRCMDRFGAQTAFDRRQRKTRRHLEAGQSTLALAARRRRDGCHSICPPARHEAALARSSDGPSADQGRCCCTC
jgi:ABC transporter